jgi:hypothetical protein
MTLTETVHESKYPRIENARLYLIELMHDTSIMDYLEERRILNPSEFGRSVYLSQSNNYAKVVNFMIEDPHRIGFAGKEYQLVEKVYRDVQALKKTNELIKDKKYFWELLGSIENGLQQHNDQVMSQGMFQSTSEMNLFNEIYERLGDYTSGEKLLTPRFIGSVDYFFDKFFSADDELQGKILVRNHVLKLDFDNYMRAELKSLKNVQRAN